MLDKSVDDNFSQFISKKQMTFLIKSFMKKSYNVIIETQQIEI